MTCGRTPSVHATVVGLDFFEKNNTEGFEERIIGLANANAISSPFGRGIHCRMKLKTPRHGRNSFNYVSLFTIIGLILCLNIGDVLKTLSSQQKSILLEESNMLNNLLVNETIQTIPKSPPGLYFCIGGPQNGMREYRKVMESVLPEYRIMDFSVVNKKVNDEYLVDGYTNEHDVFFTNHHPSTCSNVAMQWMLTQFSGHVVIFTGESNKANPVTKVDREKKFHYFGAAINPREHDLRLTYLQITWFDHFVESLSAAKMVDPALRPRNKGREKYCLGCL